MKTQLMLGWRLTALLTQDIAEWLHYIHKGSAFLTAFSRTRSEITEVSIFTNFIWREQALKTVHMLK